MTEFIGQNPSTENPCVHQRHIDRAFSKIQPSVSETVHFYEASGKKTLIDDLDF